MMNEKLKEAIKKANRVVKKYTPETLNSDNLIQIIKRSFRKDEPK